jgi:uncharacterized protein (DUF433 family)
MIIKKRNICDGRAIFAGTRIPVFQIVQYKKIRVGDRQLLESFPALKQTDLEEAWNYYQANKKEIEIDIEASGGKK